MTVSSWRGATTMALIAATLVACTATGVREVRREGAEKVYESKCKGSSDACIAGARATCKGGYETLENTSHNGGYLGDNGGSGSGPVTWYVLTFKCGTPKDNAPGLVR